MSADEDMTTVDVPARMRSTAVKRFDYLLGGVAGILLAGVTFPSLVALIALVAIACTNGINGGVDMGIVIEVVGLVFFACCVSATISLLTGLGSVFLIWIASESLGNPLDHRAAAISAGSFAGYLPTVGFVTVEDIAVVLPILAACMGAIGASWTARKQYMLFSTRPPVQQAKYRLTIWRLMAATAWVAVVFAIANLTGSLFFVFAIAGWIVLNALLLGMAKLYRAFRPDPLYSNRTDT